MKLQLDGFTNQRRVEVLRTMVRTFYDFQRCRISLQNRSVAVKKQLKEPELFTFYDNQIDAMCQAEAKALVVIKALLKNHPMGTKLLRNRGIGAAIAGVILAELGHETPQGKGIARFPTVSSLWAYCGLAVVDGRPSGVEDEGFDKSKRYGKAPHLQRGVKATWNTFLRAKLLGVLGGSLLRQKSKYSTLYYEYKLRKEEEGWGVSKNHRHRAAIRYMVKQLLLDVYIEWRALEGLNIPTPYDQRPST